MIRLKTIDAHAAGEPLRLIVDGFPSPRGRSMLDKREWLRAHADHLRRALMLEPRGHADMYGAILTEPVSPGSHAGVLFMHNDGYSTMCGHGVIAVTTIALERGLIVAAGSEADVAFGGAFYAIVDSEAVGLPIDAAHLPELRRAGMDIKHAVEASQTIVHP